MWLRSTHSAPARSAIVRPTFRTRSKTRADRFIRAETIRWDQLLEAGSEANARAKGILRLEGKDYIVQDGDVMHIRHSG